MGLGNAHPFWVCQHQVLDYVDSWRRLEIQGHGISHPGYVTSAAMGGWQSQTT